MDELKSKLEEFKALYNQSNKDMEKLNQLMKEMRIIAVTKLQFKSPSEAAKSKSVKDIYIMREITEYSVHLAIENDDMKAFERHMQSLKTYYFDYKNLPQSEHMYPFLGIYLLYLLSSVNKLGEFHTELERIPDPTNRYIRFSIELEQSLMEGRYGRLNSAKDKVPEPVYEKFVDKLIDSVKDEIAECLENSYTKLPLSEAKRLLMFRDMEDDDFQSFVKKHEWKVDNDVISFVSQEEESESVDSVNLIERSLKYAHELERII